MNKIGTTFLIVVMSLLFLSFTACNESNSNTNANKAPAGKVPAASNVKTGVKPVADAQVAVLDAGDYGRIVIELYPNIAPQHVERCRTDDAIV